MLIYKSLDAARAAEPGLVVTAQGENAPAGTFEKDWGYRLRGAGLPGGEIGWLLTFAGLGSGFGEANGWLIAYEIVHDEKTGRLAMLRRDWDTRLDDSELEHVRQIDGLWDARRRHDDGEADLDVLDAELQGARLP